jgi:hypothetical protein
MKPQATLGQLVELSRSRSVAGFLTRESGPIAAQLPDGEFRAMHHDEGISFGIYKDRGQILYAATTTLPFSPPEELIATGTDAEEMATRAFTLRRDFFASTPKYMVTAPARLGPEPTTLYAGNSADGALSALAAHEPPFPGADMVIWDAHSGTKAGFLAWSGEPVQGFTDFKPAGFVFFDAHLARTARLFHLPLAVSNTAIQEPATRFTPELGLSA